jgi:hypothetical protein
MEDKIVLHVLLECLTININIGWTVHICLVHTEDVCTYLVHIESCRKGTL